MLTVELVVHGAGLGSGSQAANISLRDPFVLRPWLVSMFPRLLFGFDQSQPNATYSSVVPHLVLGIPCIVFTGYCGRPFPNRETGRNIIQFQDETCSLRVLFCPPLSRLPQNPGFSTVWANLLSCNPEAEFLLKAREADSGAPRGPESTVVYETEIVSSRVPPKTALFRSVRR